MYLTSRFLAVITLLSISINSLQAQVGINNPTPAASSILDLTSTDKGFLTPRMSTAQRLAITAPATGLLVFDNTLNKFYYYDGSVWRPFSDDSSGWLTTGNAGTISGTNFLGTIDAQDLDIRTNDTIRFRFTQKRQLEFIDAMERNIRIGSEAGEFANGQNNVVIGYQALFSNSTSSAINNNVFVGAHAGQNLSFGQFHTVIGYTSGSNMTNAVGNSFYGSSAGNNTTTGSNNTIIGYGSGFSNTTGQYNTFTGKSTGSNNQTGSNNTAYGAAALFSNSLISNLVAVGDSAMFSNTTGVSNTAIGSSALKNNSIRDHNTAVGYRAMEFSVLGARTTAIGSSSIGFSADGTDKTAVGYKAMYASHGSRNSALGVEALTTTTTSNNENTAIGYFAMRTHSGSNNTAVGAFSLEDTGSGFDNVAVGHSALNNTAGGYENVAVGSNALLVNGTGHENVAVGKDALQANIIGDRNIAVGKRALYLTASSDDNVAIGQQAQENLATGDKNVALGNLSLQNNTSGSDNIAIGHEAMANGTSPGNNIALGRRSLFQSTSTSNVCMGNFSGSVLTSGSGNTILGDAAGNNLVTGSSNTYLGRSARGGSAALVNSSAIGARSQVNVSNALVLGSIAGLNGSVVTSRVGIGTASPLFDLHVGDGTITAINASNTRVVVTDNTLDDRSAFIALARTSTGARVEAQMEADGDFNNAVIMGSSSAHNLLLRTSNITRATLTTAGNLGIGFTAPTQRLHVNGNTLTNGDFYTAAGDGVINCGGGIMNALINVIADFTPSPVVVNGDEDLYIQDDLELGSQGYKPGGGTWVAVSDMRLKKNIKPYKDGLNRILSINPVTYQYNNRMSTLNNGVTYVGVIAQEMKEIAPYTVEEKSFGEVTSEDENGKTVVVQQGENYYTFDPSALTYMLINAVRELNQKIADQQQELDQLKEMVDK